jgi:arylsulfatase A-like enzyme
MGRAPRTVAEVFRENGWRTAGFAANLFYATHETGVSRGFTRWEDFKVSLKQIVCGSTLAQTAILRQLFWPDPGENRFRALKNLALKGDPKPEVDRRTAVDVGSQFIDWLGNEEHRPFFAYLNFFDAHEPYIPPPAYQTRFVADKPKDRDRYDGGIAYMDEEVGRILAELKRRGVLDRTFVVIAGDHGEQFGEHNLTTHGNSLYIQLVHVPLIMRFPGKIPAGVRVNRSVSLRDLPRTLLDVAGIADTKGIFGTSLVEAIKDSAFATSAIVAETEQTPKWAKVPSYKGPMSSLMDQRYHYIRSSAGAEWLFDYRADPAETKDLIKDPGSAAVLAEMRTKLGTHRKPLNSTAPPATVTGQ